MASATAAETSPMATATATGAAMLSAGRALRKASAVPEPAATLGMSDARRRKNDDSAWVSPGSGGTTSVTTMGCPVLAATVPKAWVRKLAGAVPPPVAMGSPRVGLDATSAPSTCRWAIAVRASAALG